MQELRKDGFDLAETRYKELKPILDEVLVWLDKLLFWQSIKHIIDYQLNNKIYSLSCKLQLAVLEAEQKAEEAEGPETSNSRKKGAKKKHMGSK